MSRIIPSIENAFHPHSASAIHAAAQVIDLEEEKKIGKEVQALIELHDFIKMHPDAPVKDIARFMPPIDARVASKAIQALAIRDQHMSAEQKAAMHHKVQSVSVEPKVKRWGK
jgi:hypothetical protein